PGARHLGIILLLALLVIAPACELSGSSAAGSPTAPAATADPSTATTAATATAPPSGASVATATTQAAPPAATSVDLSQAVIQVVQNVKPAVVQITNEQVQINQFNQPLTVPRGVGSGVIYDDQGHILTNNHVIAGAEQLLVSLPDGRSFPATIVGADPQT